MRSSGVPPTRFCRSSVRSLLAAFAAGLATCGPTALAADPTADVVVVVGAGGTDEYASDFEQWAGRWAEAAAQADADLVEPENRDRLLEVLGSLKSTSTETPLWVVLLGHGTYQQGQAKFNLRGPDVSAEEFAAALTGATRPLVIINASSASGPFLAALSGENRVVVTATRTGEEQNFARFGDYLSRAIGDPMADLDHDQGVSILEAFLAASADTQQFYEREGRLATEHALLDDNGDALGTPADFFRGIRVVRQSEGDAQPDGRLAGQFALLAAPADAALSDEQQQRIAELEQRVHELRIRKSELESDAYYAELEKVLLEMAELYEQSSPTDR